LNSSSAALTTSISPLMEIESRAEATRRPAPKSKVVPAVTDPPKVRSSSTVTRRSPPPVVNVPRIVASETSFAPSPDLRMMS
jgi:hypothetical protein